MRLPAILTAALLAGLPVCAQFDLATTYDGSVLYFSSFPSSSNKNVQIYRWSQDAGLTLFGDRPDLAQASVYGERLYGTELTDEGTVIFHAEAGCATPTGGPGGNTCPVGQTEIVTPGLQPFSLDNILLISPNGRYGVWVPYRSGGLWVDWWTGEQIEVDFMLQGVPNVNPPYGVNQHAVANNGSFVIRGPGGSALRVWSKSGDTLVPAPDGIGATISADGSTVALSTQDQHPTDGIMFPTYVYDVASGRQVGKFAAGPSSAGGTFFSMSDDGQTVAYLVGDVDDPPPGANAQAFVAHADGIGARQITFEPEGVRWALLSGDARYLYVTIGDPDPPNRSRIRRYEVATGAFVDLPVLP